MTEESAAPPPQSSGRGSALVGAGIFLSRLLGLARQTLIAMFLGAGPVADAFNAAFRITNILQNLFGEGALSASFIPVYSRALGKGDDEEADRVAGAVAAFLGLVSALIVALGVLATPLFVKVVAGGFTGEKLELTIRLTRILFPGAGIFVLSAWCLGILNSHRRFFLSYAAPVFWNIAMIVALVAFGPRSGETELAVVLAWASVVGAALQMGVQVPSVFRLLKHPRFRLDYGYPPVRDVVHNFLPAFVIRGVVQLSGYIDVFLASFISEHGVMTLIANAQTIYMLPVSLFGMSVSAAELPEMSRDSGTGADALERLQRRLNAALPRVAFFVVPSAIAFFVLGEAIAGVILQHGKFNAVDSVRTWAILAGSAVGLLANALGRLYSSTFYALRDTRTPLRFAIARVVMTGILGYVFAFPLPRLLGLPAWTGGAGLTVASGLAACLEFLLLRRAISARVGRTRIDPSVMGRLLAAGALAGAAGFGVMYFMNPAHQTLRGASALVVFTVVYGAATLAFGVAEAQAMVARVRRR